MEHDSTTQEAGLTSLEDALQAMEAQAAAAQAAVRRLASIVRSARRAAQQGDLKGLRRALEGAQAASLRAGEQMVELRAGWKLSEAEEESYLSSGAYTRELRQAAREAGLALYEQDGILSCYPSLVRVQPRDRAVRIDRKLHRQIRPSYLVRYLLSRQKHPPRLHPEQFLETLLAAYEVLSGQRRGSMEKLVDIYRILTLLPGARRDYPQWEFARDVYLLDASGLKTTRDGIPFRLHAGATGAKRRTNLLVVITREGVERTYYGIEFQRS